MASFCFIPYFGILLALIYSDPNMSMLGAYLFSAFLLVYGVITLAMISGGVRVLLIDAYEKYSRSRDLQMFPLFYLFEHFFAGEDNSGSKSSGITLILNDEDFSLQEATERKSSFTKTMILLLNTGVLIIMPIGLAVLAALVLLENVISIVLALAINKRVATFSGVVIGSIVAKTLEYSYGWNIVTTAIICWLVSTSVAYTIYFIREGLGYLEDKWEQAEQHC